ncbi:hypothetical protein [Paraburkholderia sp. SIMBA_054]|uniref:hypothetical protein n=1 Tax=Paraburkholderia sp. SIMBA_054 TaxID=3085795 RepID=UPI0039796C5C
MKKKSASARTLLACSVMLFGGGASAGGPAHCSPGFQDSACATQLTHTASPQPDCSANGAGWTTVTASVWQGSRWSAPGCSYTPPPTCPAGYSQTSAPWWNGSSWIGLGCAAPPPPPPPPSASADPVATCNAYTAGQGFPTTWNTGFNLPIGNGVYAFTESWWVNDTNGNIELECDADSQGGVVFFEHHYVGGYDGG